MPLNKIWVIGDVHGNYETLMKLLNKLPEESNNTNTFFLGDLIDRGPKSREVVSFIKDNNYTSVLGNHEDMMIDSHAFNDGGLWLSNGGTTTLFSYDGFYDTRKEHLEWMQSLPTIVQLEITDSKNVVLSHAPILHHIDELLGSIDNDSKKYRLREYTLWNRRLPSISHNEYFNISGHNITEGVIQGDSFASIDTGSCHLKPGYGILTCLEYPSMKLYQQETID